MTRIRRRFSRRQFLGTAGVLGAGATLAACTPASPTVAPTQPPAATQAPVATQPPAATEATMPQVSGNLEMMHFIGEGAAYYNFMLTLGDEFKAANPDLNLSWVWGGSDYANQFRARMLANDPPTASAFEENNMRLWAAEGLLVKLDDFLEGSNYDGTGRWLDDFAESVRSRMIMDPGADGPGYYGIPYETFINSIWYNTKLYNELGLQEPSTWAEFLSNCEALKAAGYWPIAHDGNISGYNRRWWFHLIGSLVGGAKYRATLLNEPGTSWTGEPGFLRAAELVHELYEKEYFQPGYQGYQWPAAQIDFATERAGQIMMSSGLYSEIVDAIPEGFSMSTFNTPIVEGGAGDGPNTIWEFKFNAFFVPTGSDNVEAAVEWFKYNTSRAVQQRQASEEGLQRPPSVAGVEMTPLHAGTARMLDTATLAWPREYGGPQLAPDWAKQVLEPLYDPFFYGQTTPEEFINELQAKHDEFYGN
jgi:raffinose/stachyose/melibiose transport system substrate-binding protein